MNANEFATDTFSQSLDIGLQTQQQILEIGPAPFAEQTKRQWDTQWQALLDTQMAITSYWQQSVQVWSELSAEALQFQLEWLAASEIQPEQSGQTSGKKSTAGKNARQAA